MVKKDNGMTDNARNNSYAFLPNRSILSVSGPDARQFLQGLISNDMRKVSSERAIWAALLTPQGKFLHDFFITERDGAFFLEVETHRREDLIKKLKLYRLRAKVDLIDESPHLVVAVIFGDPITWPQLSDEGAAAAFGTGKIYRDPRLSAAGLRLVSSVQDAASLSDKGYREVSVDDYDQWRLGLGLPDGSRDLVLEKATLMESGFDELHGIDWSKGCYIGQELTARMKYRGLVKKRLVPITASGTIPEPGTIILKDGSDVGEIRSSRGRMGLALIRIDVFAAASSVQLRGLNQEITAHLPSWMKLPEAKPV